MDFNKKEMPIQGITGFGGGATGAAFRSSGGAGEYIDDIFGITLYTGNEGSKTVTTNIDLATDGGMLWGKSRDGNHAPFLYDTTRGVTKYLRADVNAGQVTLATSLTAFSTSGFSLGSHVGLNDDVPNVAWSFKKIPGFFDFVTYTGNGSSNHQISHNLGSVPGCIMVKCTSESQDWMVYHVGTTDSAGPGGAYLKLNEPDDQYGSSGGFYNTTATDSIFTLGDANIGNKDGASYVAYIWAGGESTAATAASVDFGGDNSNTKSYQRIAGSSPASWRDFGTANFTFEMWVRPDGLTTDNYHKRIFSLGSSVSACISLEVQSNASAHFRLNDTIKVSSDANTVPIGQWTHIAVARESNTLRLFINGYKVSTITTFTDDVDFSGSGNALWIGNLVDNDSGSWNGQISNFRIVKGTAVYTTSFKLPTEPLTSITNTILLTCNDPTNKNASTITPATKAGYGNEGAKADSPFDDPEGFIFGEGADQNVVSMGRYTGNGSSTGPEIYLGWEPSWIMVKNATSNSRDWKVLDCMRGIVTGRGGSYDDDRSLVMNDYTTEVDESVIDLTPTGFKLKSSNAHYNENGETIIYMAIRRSDGYVGKPSDAGTNNLTIVAGTSGAPLFVSSNHIVDFALQKSSYQSGTADWSLVSRLTQGNRLETNKTTAEAANQYQVGDYQNGWSSYTGGDGSRFGFLFKRSAGLDVITYTGLGANSAPREFPHSLGKSPEMIWIKNRESSVDWVCWHKGLNGGGSNAVSYNLRLNTNAAQSSNSDIYGGVNGVLPTETHWTTGGNNMINESGSRFTAVLFSSVSGISDVGSYTGNGSATGPVITTGFQPRFIMFKNASSAGNGWAVLDTVRGLGTSSQKRLWLDWDESENAGGAAANYVTTTSTGFQPVMNNTEFNENGSTIIYWAHA